MHNTLLTITFFGLLFPALSSIAGSRSYSSIAYCLITLILVESDLRRGSRIVVASQLAKEETVGKALPITR